MRFRKLRIAWSIGFALACVLLIVFWVRSYSAADVIYGQIYSHKAVTLMSKTGRIGALLYDVDSRPWGYERMSFTTRSVHEATPYARAFGFGLFRDAQRGLRGITVPFGFAVHLGAIVAAAPWIPHIPWRFSLRALLIATTLIAVVLGLIAWLSG